MVPQHFFSFFIFLFLFLPSIFQCSMPSFFATSVIPFGNGTGAILCTCLILSQYKAPVVICLQTVSFLG